ncbi:MAG: hypothetical protein KGH63_01345, partial [Candidatus Micrarchaeota archaeon]|nr:hypothetical protein [Candidatus Micrarchaeota archaeon]
TPAVASTTDTWQNHPAFTKEGEVYYPLRPGGTPAQKIASKTPSLFAQSDAVISDFLLSASKRNAMPGNSFGQYVDGEYRRMRNEVTGPVGRAIGLTTFGMLTATATDYSMIGGEQPVASLPVYPNLMQTGFRSDGSIFVAIDRETYDKISRPDRYGNRNLFPSYVVPSVPGDGHVVAEGRRSGNRWNQTVLLNEGNAAQLLAPFSPLRQHLSYLYDQARAGLQNGAFASAAAKCGSISASSPELASETVGRGAALLVENAPPISRTQVEQVAFYSFTSYQTELHPWLFGYAAGEGEPYYVVDAKSGVRGKGATREEAIEDMVSSGYCLPGAYYRFDKRAGQPATAASMHVYVTSHDERWWRTTLGSLSYLQAGYVIPSGYTQAAGVVGTLAEMLDDQLDRNERAFRMGESFRWKSGAGAELAIQWLLVAATAAEPALKALDAVRTLKAVEYGTGGSLLGLTYYSNQLAMTRLVDTQVQHSGTSLVNVQGTPADAQRVLDRMMVPLYVWATGEKTFSDLDHPERMGKSEQVRLGRVMNRIRENWSPLLTQATGQVLPYGSPMPLGIAPADVGNLWVARISRNSDWIHAHYSDVQLMAQRSGWELEDTVLAILAYGGPLIEGTQEKTLAEIRALPPNAVANAAKYLESQERKAGLPSNAADLRLNLPKLWLSGAISTTQLAEWAKAGAALNRTTPGGVER